MLSDNGGEVVQDQVDDNVIYIVDSFDENHLHLIDELQTRGIRIISTKCLYETLNTKRPLPTINYPLYSRCLEGKIIAIDYTIDENMKHQLAKLTRFLGGELSDTVTSKTDYLLANKIGSIFYKAAAHQFDEIEILVPSWITDCWDKQQFLPTAHYILPPFTGCIISVTGILSPKRKKIQDLTTKNGGEYSPDLTRKCTHLLSEQPRGLKYTYALDWGIHCVRTTWFYETIKKRTCQDETLHYLPEPTKRDLLSVNNYHELNRLSPTLRRKHIQKNTGSRYGLVVITNSKIRPIEDELNEGESINILSDLKKEIINDQDPLKKEDILSLIEKMKTNEDIYETIQKLIEFCDKVIHHFQSLTDKEKELLKGILANYSREKK